MGKKYFMPVGNWSIGVGYTYAHKLLESLGISKSDEKNSDILVLPGGTDIGENPERDSHELNCLNKAREENKKIFGICRGFQFMLHTSGSTIINHIPDYSSSVEHRTLTGNWKGQSSWHTTDLGLLVNTRHHQGAIQAIGWDVIDRCSDGIIEAACRKNEFGVQWHPEHPEMIGTPALSWLERQLKIRDFL